MKKHGFICLAFAMSMIISANCFAAEKKVDDMVVDSQFSLVGGECGTKVKKLSNGEFIDSIYSFRQFMDALDPVVEVSGTMGGEKEAEFYWSGDNYTYNDSTCKSVAVMHADSSAKWSDESCIIFKIGDIANEVDGLRVYMGASADGPRDIELEYSIDGEIFLPLNTSGDKICSLSKADTIESLVEVDLQGIQRSSHLAVFKDDKYTDFTWRLQIFDSIYIRAKVASDYRMDGRTGLYGADRGELAVHSVELLYVNDIEVAPALQTPSVQAYKTGDRVASISWNRIAGADGYEVYVKKGNRKYKKQKVVAGAKRTKYNLNGLSPKGVYRIKLRSYALEGKKKIYGDYSKEVVVNMSKQPLPKDLKINKKIEVRLRKAKRVNIGCTSGKSKGYIDSIQYKVKNPKIAIVKNGIITAKKAGTTTLTVNVKLKSGLSRKLTTKIIVRK